MWCKHTNYEIDTRVPFIIEYPGEGVRSGRTEALVELIDLLPALAELTGLDAPYKCEGDSLVKLLENPVADWSELASALGRCERLECEI